MNKTLSIGLAGFSFTIEEHAYIKLSDYLAALRNSLDSAEADEVMHDIEIRMVEIFKDSLGKREVINDIDVERVISQIGKPEVIEEQEEAYFSEKTAKKQQKTSKGFSGQKQLFRDPSRAKIAGVCAGLSHYTGLDVTLIRGILVAVIVLDIFFTFAISTSFLVLLYIILWIVLPKAETASDFLKMEGKPANFDNLKEQSNKIVQFANDSTQRVGEIYTENKPYINKAGNGLWNVVRYVFGALFAFMSVMLIVGLFAVFGMVGNPHFSGINEIDFLFDGEMSWVFKALITLGTLIPALLFGLLAIKLLSPKTQIRNLGYVLGGIFLAIIALGTYFGISMAQKEMIYKGHKEDVENIAINTESDSIFLDVKDVVIPQNFTAYDNDIFSDKKSVFEDDYPFVEVTRKAGAKTPYLIVKKEAEGYNVPIDLKVPVEIVGNKVLFPNFVQYPYNHRFRDYNVNYELVIPQNTKVFEVRKDKITLRGDVNGNGIADEDENDDNNDSNSNSQENSQITINGKTWNIQKTNDNDSVIINNKKYSEAEAEKVMDSMKIDFKNMKDVNISVKNGDKQVTIKTNK